MSIIGEINDFFSEYGDRFDMPTINYTKQVVHKIKTSDVLHTFIDQNNISASVLLNEITPYSQWKYKTYGDEKLDMKEIQSILNIIIFSKELEDMILQDHVVFSSIGEMGELYYRADEFAAEYFNVKYDINIVEDVEFDYTILENHDSEGASNFDFGVN